VFSNEEIIQTVWGASDADPAVLKNAIYRLRRKLEAEGLEADAIIRTWQKGYSFQE
jgi:DNA-binding winged helix-turn-helix (wHTH) protein